MKIPNNAIELLNEFGYEQCKTEKRRFMRNDMGLRRIIDLTNDLNNPEFYGYEDRDRVDVNDDPENVIIKKKLNELTFEDEALW